MKPYFESKATLIFKDVHDSSHDFPSHFHSNLEIAYCFSGSQKIKIGDAEFLLGAGDAVIIFPNMPHEYIRTGSVAARNLSVICNTRLLAEILPDTVTKYAPDPFVPSSCVSDKAILAFEGIDASEDEAQMLGWTYIALSELLGAMRLEFHGGDRDLPAKVIKYIDENFKEDLTIDRISRAFGYHPSYIAHVFCDQLKISFRTYLGAVRAEYAAAQIRTTQKSLTEIAYESGCNSLNTFCRCFKKHFGMTPSQYKKSISKENT